MVKKTEWIMTRARRKALENNWKIYILRGWVALCKIYGFYAIRHVIEQQIAELGGEYEAKTGRKRRVVCR